MQNWTSLPLSCNCHTLHKPPSLVRHAHSDFSFTKNEKTKERKNKLLFPKGIFYFLTKKIKSMESSILHVHGYKDGAVPIETYCTQVVLIIIRFFGIFSLVNKIDFHKRVAMQTVFNLSFGIGGSKFWFCSKMGLK